MATALQSTASAAGAINRVNYSHDAMIDMIIATPGISQNELAKTFGYTPAWVSRVMCSDAFQARLAERKSELVDPTLTLSIEEKVRALATKSLDIVMDKLTAVPDASLAMKVVETFSKSDVYGVRQRDRTPSQAQFVVMLPPKADSPESWAEMHGPQRMKTVSAEIIQDQTSSED